MKPSIKPFLVGITGGSASGKTLFLQQLISSFKSDEICLISQDNYYKPLEEQPLDENGIPNFDLPESLDHQLYAGDIQKLKNGISVHREEYVFNNPAKKPKTLIFNPSPIIVIEGIFVFYHSDIYNQMDLKIFIDAKEHIKIKRRIIRDNVERGYDLDDVLYRYENHVAPTYEKYIKPFKYDADLIIPNNYSFDKAMEVLVTFLKSNLNK